MTKIISRQKKICYLSHNREFRKLLNMRLIFVIKKVTIIDPSGQTTERQKWIKQFQIVDGILWIVPISHYDIFADSDSSDIIGGNAILEDLYVLEQFIPIFGNTIPFFVLFNKIDLFKEKIKITPISQPAIMEAMDYCMMEYEGNVNCYDECIDLIQQIFISRSEQIKCYQISAMDKNHVEKTFNDIVSSLHNI
eukprot:423548_1